MFNKQQLQQMTDERIQVPVQGTVPSKGSTMTKQCPVCRRKFRTNNPLDRVCSVRCATTK